MPDLEAILWQFHEQQRQKRIILPDEDRPDKYTIIGSSEPATIEQIKAKLDANRTKPPQPSLSRRNIPVR